MPKKLLVVDDSALMRRVLSDIIDDDKRFVLEDAADNGLEAYDMIVTNPGKYDLIILDINMPKMNGIQLLEKMNEKNIHIPTLIVSTIAKEGAAETLQCLELGAFDFITKPDSFLETKSEKFKNKIIRFMCGALGMPEQDSGKAYDVLSHIEPRKNVAPPMPIADPGQAGAAKPIAPPKPFEIPKAEEPAKAFSAEEALARVTEKTVAVAAKAKQAAEQRQAKEETASDAESAAPKKKGADVLDGPMSYVKVTDFKRKPHVSVKSDNKLVAIACSTGGPKALQQVIPYLPADLNAPVILVQHMPEGFTGTLASRLNEISAVNVLEAEDGAVLQKGTVYIAKGGKHLRVVKKGSDLVVELGSDEPRNSLRPCADIMYESLINLDIDEIVCVVLTGMGSDGTRGIGQLGTKKNIYVIAQDEASSTVYGMPRMVKEAELTDEVVTLSSIAGSIAKIIG